MRRFVLVSINITLQMLKFYGKGRALRLHVLLLHIEHIQIFGPGDLNVIVCYHILIFINFKIMTFDSISGLSGP